MGKKKERVSELSKTILDAYIAHQCERQLFINLGRNDSRWMSPVVEIAKLESIRRGPPGMLAQMGKDYEQKVYASLRRFPNAVFSETAEGKITFNTISKDDLEQLYSAFIQDRKTRIYLEAGIPIPDIFYRMIFNLKDDEEIPVKSYTKTSYPDIIILGEPGNTQLELDGSIRPLSGSEQENKIGITIIDIKKTNEEEVGKKYFIEILFYALAIRYFLEDTGLSNKFYLNPVGNGIFPSVDQINLNLLSDLRMTIQEMDWEENYRLIESLLAKIRDLWVKSPMSLEDTETYIKSKCGRCEYYDDCLNREGINGNPKDMSVKLLPYTSLSTVKQLDTYNINTVGELMNKINTIIPGNTPKPIYPELPLLRLKGKAISSNSSIIPDEGDIHSVSIPKFSDIAITINFEEDPTHDRVFGFSLFLRITSSTYTPYFNKMVEWWRIWSDFLSGDIEAAELAGELDYGLQKTIKKGDLREMSKIIRSVFNLGADLRLKGKAYERRDKTKYIAEVSSLTLSVALVNEDLEDNTEYELTKVLVKILYQILRLSEYLEVYIRSTMKTKDGGEKDTYPSTAIYYWSQEILEILEKLIQRQLVSLLKDNDLNTELSYLINWFTPNESRVKNAEQIRKIFDMRQFIETTQGLPHPINYTWHKIYESETGSKPHRNYFSPHLNYMDHNNFYQFLVAKEETAATILDGKKSKSEYREEIKEQLLYKVRAIDRLRLIFQQRSRHLISRSNYRPVDSEAMSIPKVPTTYHEIARIWFLYSRLTGALAELDADNFRHMYPEYSIGKLAAGEVTNLRVVDQELGGKGKLYYIYEFNLKGLSSNMKLSEGKSVLLLPYELRDFGGHPRIWQITIQSMEWDSQSGEVIVRTEKTGTNFELKYLSEVEENRTDKWYLYPIGGEFWTSKLRTLLSLFNLGNSWLGSRLAYLWQITDRLPPAVSEVTIPEIYMYHPRLLDPFINSYTQLTTQVQQPNPSQERAILNSLSRVVSSIQGPPGTGKSQTIVALIDEFVRMSDRSVKILITSFSYQALNVLVDKLSDSKNSDGTASIASQLTRVFLRGDSREPSGKCEDLCKSGSWKINGETGIASKGKTLDTEFDQGFIMFGVAHQLYKLQSRKKNGELEVIDEDFAFDLIIVDEASQMPIDQILASIVLVRRMPASLLNLPTGDDIMAVDKLHKIAAQIHTQGHLTKLVLVGDYNQLPPVQSIPPPKKLEPVLGSLFSYYIEQHQVSNVQLEINYRSHEIIVEYTRRLGFYQELSANAGNALEILEGDMNKVQKSLIKDILDPQKVVSTIIHNHEFDTAISTIEAQLTVDIIIEYYRVINPQTKEEERDFFLETVGVVAPHNAQSSLIIRTLYERLNQEFPLNLDDKDLMSALKMTIFSVEKFQGSDRNLIIGTIGISSLDQLQAEEEFIYEINRFNVLTSRAKNKIILICSRNFLDYFPDSREVVSSSSKIIDYALDFCNSSKKFRYNCNEHNIDEDLEFRYRDSL
ncbi:MAG: AAA family ATPase [Candidatus Heimdallarchaeota archaeon]|nr:AAA family ATPase [Candidatus Heimdallarchaeota archaeon]